MRTVHLSHVWNFDEWRRHARALLADGIKPEQVLWKTGTENDLFSALEEPESAPHPLTAHHPIRVPRSFPSLAEAVLCHNDPARFAFLYRVLVRLQSERNLLSIMTDPDVIAVRGMAKVVHHDCHRMTGFVRFREVTGNEPLTKRRQFAAWFEPDHYIVARTAPFFCRRFSDMDWAILTPKGSATFVEQELFISDEPASNPDVTDDTDELWRTYYASIFNPARLKVKTMQGLMPKKYWANLPEASLIPELIAGAQERVDAMAAQDSSQQP